VVLLEREVLVGEDALRVAAAAHVDADARVAVPGDVGMRERVPLRGSLAPASTGSHRRAASRVPSVSGIQTGSRRSTARGNALTVVTAPHYTGTRPARCAAQIRRFEPGET